MWKGDALMRGKTQVGSVAKVTGPLGVAFEMFLGGRRLGQCGGGLTAEARKRAQQMVFDIAAKEKP